MGDGNSSSTNTSTVKKCATGEVWNKAKKKCMKAQSGILPDEELYEQGRPLAFAGQYDWAITVLASAKNQNDPKILNYLGYSHRKAGRLETGIGYYRRALAIDPNYVKVREYLGEGYAAAGRLDLARDQLREIADRCGTSCEAYRRLAQAVAGGPIL